MGASASDPFRERLTGAAFVVNGYWHLADANNLPSAGAQIAYKATDELSLKQTVLIGPHQADTSLRYWRYLSDSIVEWKTGPVTTVAEAQLATEQVAHAMRAQAFWYSAQLPVHWTIDKHFAATLRPEVARDSDGRWTTASQTIAALTTTIESRASYHDATAIVRLEYRYDHSTGRDGGFFHDAYVNPGVVALTPNQHLLGLALIVTYDGSGRP